MARRSGGARITNVYGTVMEAIADELEPRARLVIVAPDEVEYFVIDDAAGRELEDLVGEEVEVRGIVARGRNGGQRTLQVLELSVPAWEEGLDFDIDIDIEDDWDPDWDPGDLSSTGRRRRAA